MAIQKRDRYMAALLGVAVTSPSYAYLDPGTGSIILQSILASIAVAMGLLRFYWHQFKAFFANLMGSSPKGQSDPAKEFEMDSDSKNES